MVMASIPPAKRTPDINVYRVDAMDAATEMKNEKAFNMLILGGLLKIAPMVQLENVMLGLKKRNPCPSVTIICCR